MLEGWQWSMGFEQGQQLAEHGACTAWRASKHSPASKHGIAQQGTAGPALD